MKQRHQRKENYPIGLEDILEEIQEGDLSSKIKNILDTHTLLNNPKIESRIEDGLRKYTFKPFYNIRNRKDLINLVKDSQMKAAGGVLLDDVQESVPDADEMLKKIGDEIIVMVGKGKKKVLYYNDKNTADNIVVEEDIVKYWRDVAVDGMDETKIDDYLEKQGIASMKDLFASNRMQVTGKRKGSGKGRQVKKHNDHMGGVLTEYNPDLVRKPNQTN